MSKKVYKWDGYWPRQGSLSGVFVAEEAAVKAAIGRNVHLGEALGRHSDVHGTLEENEFVALSDDPVIISFIETHGPFGRNPLNYVTVECDGCEAQMRVDEVQDYWCVNCESRLCYQCSKSDEHGECEVVEYVGPP